MATWHPLRCEAFDVHGDGHKLVTATDQGLSVLRGLDPRVERTIDHLQPYPTVCVACQHNTSLAASARGSIVLLWDIEGALGDGQRYKSLVASFRQHKTTLGQLTWAPTTPTLLATASSAGEIQLVDTRSPEMMIQLFTHVAAPVYDDFASSIPAVSVVWDPADENILLTALGKDDSVFVWDRRRLDKRSAGFEAHEGGVGGLCYAVDKHQRKVLGSIGTTRVKVWDAQSLSRSASGDQGTRIPSVLVDTLAPMYLGLEQELHTGSPRSFPILPDGAAEQTTFNEVMSPKSTISHLSGAFSIQQQICLQRPLWLSPDLDCISWTGTDPAAASIDRRAVETSTGHGQGVFGVVIPGPSDTAQGESFCFCRFDRDDAITDFRWRRRKPSEETKVHGRKRSLDVERLESLSEEETDAEEAEDQIDTAWQLALATSASVLALLPVDRERFRVNGDTRPDPPVEAGSLLELLRDEMSRAAPYGDMEGFEVKDTPDDMTEFLSGALSELRGPGLKESGTEDAALDSDPIYSTEYPLDASSLEEEIQDLKSLLINSANSPGSLSQDGSNAMWSRGVKLIDFNKQSRFAVFEIDQQMAYRRVSTQRPGAGKDGGQQSRQPSADGEQEKADEEIEFKLSVRFHFAEDYPETPARPQILRAYAKLSESHELADRREILRRSKALEVELSNEALRMSEWCSTQYTMTQSQGTVQSHPQIVQEILSALVSCADSLCRPAVTADEETGDNSPDGQDIGGVEVPIKALRAIEKPDAKTEKPARVLQIKQMPSPARCGASFGSTGHLVFFVNPIRANGANSRGGSLRASLSTFNSETRTYENFLEYSEAASKTRNRRSRRRKHRRAPPDGLEFGRTDWKGSVYSRSFAAFLPSKQSIARLLQIPPRAGTGSIEAIPGILRRNSELVKEDMSVNGESSRTAFAYNALNLLATSMEGVIHDSSSVYPWERGPLGQGFCGRLLEAFEKEGDPQMLAIMVCALRACRQGSANASLCSLDEASLSLHDRYLQAYSTLLDMWGLLAQAAEVRHHLESDDRKNTSEVDAIDTDVPTTPPRCFVCGLPVRRIFVMCVKCFHGGHDRHISEWSKAYRRSLAWKNSENRALCGVPGCGCDCEYTTQFR